MRVVSYGRERMLGLGLALLSSQALLRRKWSRSYPRAPARSARARTPSFYRATQTCRDLLRSTKRSAARCCSSRRSSTTPRRNPPSLGKRVHRNPRKPHSIVSRSPPKASTDRGRSRFFPTDACSSARANAGCASSNATAESALRSRPACRSISTNARKSSSTPCPIAISRATARSTFCSASPRPRPATSAKAKRISRSTTRRSRWPRARSSRATSAASRT